MLNSLLFLGPFQGNGEILGHNWMIILQAGKSSGNIQLYTFPVGKYLEFPVAYYGMITSGVARAKDVLAAVAL